MGYADIGEEEDWGSEHAPAKKTKQMAKADRRSSGGDAPGDVKCTRVGLGNCMLTCQVVDHQRSAGKSSGKKPVPEAQDPAAKQRMAKMFASAARRNTTVKNDAATSHTADALLDDILGEMGGSETSIKAHNPAARCDQPRSSLVLSCCTMRACASASACAAESSSFRLLQCKKMPG